MTDHQEIIDEQENMMNQFYKTFPGVLTVDDVMRLALRLHKQVDDACEVIDKWRTLAKMMGVYIPPNGPIWDKYWEVVRGEQ